MDSSLANTSIYKAISANIIQPLVYLLFGIALLYFVYGVVRYIQSLGKGDLQGKTDGQRHLLYGLIGVAIMISVFGIMNVIYNILNGPNATNLSGKPLVRPQEIDHF